MSDALPLASEDRLLTSSSTAPGQLILQAAQQTMREMREEHIIDLETALKRLGEERNRYIIFFLTLIEYTLSLNNTISRKEKIKI